MIKKQSEKTASKNPVAKPARYSQAKGGRKTARALARVFPNQSGLMVNDRDYKEYFKTFKNQVAAMAALEVLKIADKIKATVKVFGGGINAQAEAVRNAVARALVKHNGEFRGALKRSGYLTRDARMVERKKYGLKKARRAPQWAKR